MEEILSALSLFSEARKVNPDSLFSEILQGPVVDLKVALYIRPSVFARH